MDCLRFIDEQIFNKALFMPAIMHTTQSFDSLTLEMYESCRDYTLVQIEDLSLHFTNNNYYSLNREFILLCSSKYPNNIHISLRL